MTGSHKKLPLNAKLANLLAKLGNAESLAEYCIKMQDTKRGGWQFYKTKVKNLNGLDLVWVQHENWPIALYHPNRDSATFTSVLEEVVCAIDSHYHL